MESTELSQIITCHCDCPIILTIDQLDQLPDQIEVLIFESIDILFPELLTMNGSPF